MEIQSIRAPEIAETPGKQWIGLENLQVLPFAAVE